MDMRSRMAKLLLSDPQIRREEKAKAAVRHLNFIAHEPEACHCSHCMKQHLLMLQWFYDKGGWRL